MVIYGNGSDLKFLTDDHNHTQVNIALAAYSTVRRIQSKHDKSNLGKDTNEENPDDSGMRTLVTWNSTRWAY
jgi:hypothetical protein